MTGAQTGQVQHQGFNRFVYLHRNARALGQLQAVQPIGQHGAAAFQVAPAVAQTLIGLNGDLV